MPVQIGKHIVETPVLLAPMAGITDAPFRKLVASFGAGLVVSEMVASEALVLDGEEALRKARPCEGAGLNVIQLAGREARWMARAARTACDLGADIIDINMGCPAKQVTGGLSGAALMRDLDHAERLIEAVIEASDVPVTLKMRLGWDQGSITAPALARRAEAQGVEMITVHGRTRAQFFKGRADWRAISAVVRAVSLPVIANGDLTRTGQAREMLAQSGAAGVMIGRGAQGAPWFPGAVAAELKGDAKQPLPVAAQYQIAAEHYDAMLGYYGRELGLRCARKHLGWYIETALGDQTGPDRLKAWRKRLLTEEDPGKVLKKLGEFYRHCSNERAA